MVSVSDLNQNSGFGRTLVEGPVEAEKVVVATREEARDHPDKSQI